MTHLPNFLFIYTWMWSSKYTIGGLSHAKEQKCQNHSNNSSEKKIMRHSRNMFLQFLVSLSCILKSGKYKMCANLEFIWGDCIFSVSIANNYLNLIYVQVRWNTKIKKFKVYKILFHIYIYHIHNNNKDMCSVVSQWPISDPPAIMHIKPKIRLPFQHWQLLQQHIITNSFAGSITQGKSQVTHHSCIKNHHVRKQEAYGSPCSPWPCHCLAVVIFKKIFSSIFIPMKIFYPRYCSPERRIIT